MKQMKNLSSLYEDTEEYCRQKIADVITDVCYKYKESNTSSPLYL